MSTRYGTSFAGLSDTTFSNLQDCDVAKFDAASNLWVNTGISDLSNAVANTMFLNELQDVDVPAPMSGDVLQFDGADWVNTVLRINDLEDAVAPDTSTVKFRFDGDTIQMGDSTTTTVPAGLNDGSFYAGRTIMPNKTDMASSVTIGDDIGSAAGWTHNFGSVILGQLHGDRGVMNAASDGTVIIGRCCVCSVDGTSTAASVVAGNQVMIGSHIGIDPTGIPATGWDDSIAIGRDATIAASRAFYTIPTMAQVAPTGSDYTVFYNPTSGRIFPTTVGGPLAGPQGPQGDVGSQGFTGPQGVQGTQGFTGSQGPQGDVGSQGFTGPQGPQGTQGFTGPQGVQGFTGPQGVQGTQGFTGPQGVQGTQGFTGPQGVQGTQGFTGPAHSISYGFSNLDEYSTGALVQNEWNNISGWNLQIGSSVAPDNNGIVCNLDGVYDMAYGLSTSRGGATDIDLEFAIALDGLVDPSTVFLAEARTDPLGLSTGAIQSVLAGQLVHAVFRNIENTDSVNFHTGQLKLHRLDD